MATIYTGLEASWKLPGVYINVDLGRATPSAGAVTRKVLIIGNALDSGAAVNAPFFPDGVESSVGDNSLVRVPDIRKAEAYFGRGSELYGMAKAAFEANSFVELWAFVQPELTSTPVESATVRFLPVSGATYSSVNQNLVRIETLGKELTMRILSSDDLADHDAAVSFYRRLSQAFNMTLGELPYRCAVDDTAGTEGIVFIAKHPGDDWGGAQVLVDISTAPHLQLSAVNPILIGALPGVETDHQLDDVENGALNPSSSPLFAERFHYVATPYNSQNDVVDLKDFIDGQADAKIGYRQQGIFAVQALGASVETILGVCEHPRMQCVLAPGDWRSTGNYTPGQLAAAVAATRCKKESADPAANLCLQAVAGVPITIDEMLMTRTEMNDATDIGITVLSPFQGRMVIQRSVTTAANSTTTPVLDTGKVTVSDFVADDIQTKMATVYKGFKLSPDTDLPLPSRVATPSSIRQALIGWLRIHEAKGLVVQVTQNSEGIQVELDEEVAGRVNFSIPEEVIDIFAVGAGNVIQIG